MFSLTQGGILVSVIGLVAVHYLGTFGISETCSNELVQFIPVGIGAVMSWIGRYRLGGVNVLGFKR